MKLAEALAERKAIKTKMEDLKKRIYLDEQLPPRYANNYRNTEGGKVYIHCRGGMNRAPIR